MRSVRSVMAIAGIAALATLSSCYSPPHQEHAAHSAASSHRSTHAPRTHEPRTHAPRTRTSRTHHHKTTPPKRTVHRPVHKPKPKPLLVSPLSGRKPVPATPVLAVKVDDTAAARPQSNINAADVVYIEQVEAGLTRLLAVYSGAHPGEVGPVRSVRYSDVELLRQYGRIGLAYSGGAAAVVDSVHHADLIDSGAQRWGDAYYRSGAKPMPYNLMLDSNTLARHVGSFAKVRDTGLRWAASDRRFRRQVSSFSTVVGGTPVEFAWHSGLHQWIRRIGGVTTTQSDGAAVSTPNVIIQSCQVDRDARDVDVDGSASSYTRTVGSGRALVFSGGRMIDGRWSRPNAAAPTHYRDRHGKDITLRPGGVWVVLVGRGAPVTIH